LPISAVLAHLGRACPSRPCRCTSVCHKPKRRRDNAKNSRVTPRIGLFQRPPSERSSARRPRLFEDTRLDESGSVLAGWWVTGGVPAGG
jgi:hypothetical protein